MEKREASDICVVYLARAADGHAPWEAFIDSYRSCPGGMDHDLLIAFKGFRSNATLRKYAAAASGLRFNSIRLRDYGYDITSYWRAANHSGGRYKHFCFLNTYTTFSDPSWLSKLYDWVVQPNIGLVGASGSFESSYTNYRDGIIHRRIATRRSLASRIPQPLKLALMRSSFPPFPNPHLRTNAFIIRWDVMRKVWPRFIFTKRGAYRFESGFRGLTRKVMQMGLQVLVVGCDGRAYQPNRWAESNTFRMGKQENLLVADNQTRAYEAADPQMRAFMQRLAWGGLAQES